MKRIGIIGVVVAAVLAPAAALGADQPSPTAKLSAQRDCRQQLSQMGAAVFKASYGGAANAMGKCVSKFARLEQANLQSASSSCQKERAGDAAAFRAKYGVGGLGKCVSAQARAAAQKEVSAVVAAAKACAAERRADAAAFRAKYGSGPQKANAFGRCVNAAASAGANSG